MAARTKERPHVIDGVDFRGIGKDASLAVYDEGVVVPTLPQFVADLQKLVSAIVAPIVLLGFVRALDSLMPIGKRHDIPAHPPTRQMIERGEETGDVVGMLLTHGKRGGKADPRGGRSQPGEQRHWVM